MVLSTLDPAYKQCTVTVMDNIADPDISLTRKASAIRYYDYWKQKKIGLKERKEKRN
jgi:hypothetical protein